MTNIVMVLSFNHYDDYSIIRRLYCIYLGWKVLAMPFKESIKPLQFQSLSLSLSLSHSLNKASAYARTTQCRRHPNTSITTDIHLIEWSWMPFSEEKGLSNRWTAFKHLAIELSCGRRPKLLIKNHGQKSLLDRLFATSFGLHLSCSHSLVFSLSLRFTTLCETKHLHDYCKSFIRWMLKQMKWYFGSWPFWISLKIHT